LQALQAAIPPAAAVRSPGLFPTEHFYSHVDVIVVRRGPCTSQVGARLKLCFVVSEMQQFLSQAQFLLQS
jgi:hypothetical protein